MHLHNHKFIIIGSDHSNTLGQIRSLGEKGIRPIVVITEKHPFIITKSKYLGELHQVATIADAPRYVARHWGNEPEKPFLYTDRDDFVCAIDDCYDLFSGRFYFFNAGGRGLMRRLIDKQAQMAIARECGLPVIPTERVRRGQLPQALSYPIFTKATDSLNPYWKANAFICHNEAELLEAYRHMGIDDVLLQQYIDKADETPIEGISIDGGREVRLLVRKSSMRFANNGFGVYSKLQPFSDDALGQKIAAFMRKAHYSGIFEIEFIVDKEQRPYFLEVNFRNTMFNHACADFGANMPWLFAKWTLENAIDASDVKLDKRPHTVIYELEDLQESVLHGQTTLWQWLKDLAHADSYLYIDRRDWGPFLALMRRKAANALRGVLGMKKR